MNPLEFVGTKMNQLMSSSNSQNNNTQPIQHDGNGQFAVVRLFNLLVKAISQQKMEPNSAESRQLGYLVYLVSPFSLLCIFMALVVNRTVVFATTRGPTRLPLLHRLLLRSLVIYLLTKRTVSLLQALSCIDSPLNAIVPSFLAVKASCDCPTPSILWDLYCTICFSHFIEAFSNVIQGLPIYSEAGMTLFEYSMAFQEVQSSNLLNEQVIILSLMSTCSFITMHIFGILNLQKCRLIPSSIFGLGFLSYIAYSIYSGNLLNFPAICIIGYLPQLCICVTILICAFIYGLACIMTGGSQNLRISFHRFPLDMSHDFYSVLVDVGLSALTTASKASYLNETDVLTLPLTTWFENSSSSLTQAKKQKEAQKTLLAKSYQEKKKFLIQKYGKAFYEDFEKKLNNNGFEYLAPSILTYSENGIIENNEIAEEIKYLANGPNGNLNSDTISPYANEITLPNCFQGPLIPEDNNGPKNKAKYAFKTTFRITTALNMIWSLFRLIAYSFRNLILSVYTTIQNKISRSAGPGTRVQDSIDSASPTDNVNNIDMEGELQINQLKNEIVYSKLDRQYTEPDARNSNSLTTTNKTAYLDLLWGTLMPDFDDSKDYDPYDSMSEESDYSTDDNEGIYDGNESSSYRSRVAGERGQLTTRNAVTDPNAAMKELCDILIPTPQDLLSLISPCTSEEIERRRILVSHLREVSNYRMANNMVNSNSMANTSSFEMTSHPKPITRSRYREIPLDESELFLQVLEERRKGAIANNETREYLCVICQCTPRQVILWPCKCFALCEDCRVTLASKRFKGCVCCRRDVVSFSKIFVP